MRQSFSHVLQIARLTFLEAVRQRFFNFVLLLTLALIASAGFFRQLDFGPRELRFVSDFGQGGIVFFGSLLAIVAAAQLFFGEIENRTALTLLAKPVRRWSFIAGKLAGVAMLMFVFVGVLSLALGLYLKWREVQLIDLWHQAYLHKDTDVADFPAAMRVQFGGLAINGLLQWLKFDVLAAITMLVASFSNTNLYTVIVSFFIYLICQLQYIAHDSWEKIQTPFLKYLTELLGLLFPNFQLFTIGDLLIFPQTKPVPTHAVLAAFGYGMVYVLVFLGLSVLCFLTREI